MPLPLAPLLPLALRLGAVASAGYAVTRLIRARTHPGRTDQRVEDALDDMGEGLSVHQPEDRAADGMTQTNASARMVRVIRIGGRTFSVDAAFIARFRIAKGD
ncbi:hypothetical protein EI545_10090 [Tabrizicola piscis]|jgi:hypothetical protein|uniref:Uncharacterized protein n=1 Tax=Tabrizicola piscis TaxID=2494374 RepID=A0A3S8U6L3_9RHOB|nr:hypothetical protein [Tabrizicola piscis]AZL59160.1 hypothetical protein EI545_10090 [Tabrizicola piscis]